MPPQTNTRKQEPAPMPPQTNTRKQEPALMPPQTNTRKQEPAPMPPQTNTRKRSHSMRTAMCGHQPGSPTCSCTLCWRPLRATTRLTTCQLQTIDA
jgi:hypothetical protein